MRRLVMVTTVMGVAVLGTWSLVRSGRGESPREVEAAGGGHETRQAPARPEPVSPREKTPGIDTSSWRRVTTRGGIYAYRIPPGWFTRDMPDSRDRARIHTGFLVSPDRKDLSTGLYWYPNLPLHSRSSAPVKRLLDFYRPRKVGLILYKRSDTKGLFRNLRWPFLPYTTPREAAGLLGDAWFGRFAFTKWGMPRPEDFSLTGMKRVTGDLTASRLHYRLEPEPGRFRQVEGLCYLGRTGIAAGSGDWGVWLLLVQAPAGEWAEKAPILQAILESVEYDKAKHLETVGPARGAEVTQQRQVVGRLRLERLAERFRQVSGE